MKLFDSKVNLFGKDYNVQVHAETYARNGALAIELTAPMEECPEVQEPFGKLTANLEPSAPGEVYIKDWSENEGWALKFAIDNQIIAGRPTHIETTGYVHAKRYKLHPEFERKLATELFGKLPKGAGQ